MPPEEAADLLGLWHVNLRAQERSLWKAVNRRITNPPPYPVRVRRDPLPPRYDPVALVRNLPANEVAITNSLLIPSFTNLVRDFFDDMSGFSVDSCELGVPPDIGSRTTDIALLIGTGLSSDVWKDYLKFLVEVKLLSPDVSLWSCAPLT